MVEQNVAGHLEGIAVIGMAGRFPGARNLAQFWKNLRDGRESLTRFTDAQLRAAGIDPALLEDPCYVKAGILLEGVDLFDAEFFGISPGEAKLTDPQHRIFLECAWEALEDAGYNPDNTRNRIGVFAGAGMNTYLLHNLASDPELMKTWNVVQRLIASDKDFLATRVSYKLNLMGPSITIQTACSTSLVAVHLGCQSLLNGESDMVLAGGVTVHLPQVAGYSYELGSILSPDGHCRAFDAKAEGVVFSSGAGIVVLKRLADAQSDGDSIRAVIRSSCVNNDGRGKIGYTAPSVDGQAACIAEAQALAGVASDQITYVEAHGTGTPLGDPIEVAALTKAFRRTTQNKAFCAIGSLKTNVGHLDAAAGVGGLIKTILALENRALPPSLNFEQPNPNIDFANSPFYVQKTLSEWKPPNGRRLAGVSSFGVGGTNAHVIIEEASPIYKSKEMRPWQLLPISAKTIGALDKATGNLADFLEEHPGMNLADVAFTLQNGRKPFPHRRSVVAENTEDAIQLLKSRDPKRMYTAWQDQSDNSVVFMFPGQASQFVNMGLEIYKSERRFREELELCCKLLEPHLCFDLKHVLYPSQQERGESSRQLNETSVTQPAIFAVEYALAKLWMHWGIRPAAMIGHSIGEYVAACLAGVFSLEDALALIAARGRLMQSLPRGSMLAVGLKEEAAAQYLNQELSLAAVNGHSACVLAGPDPAIAALEQSLAGQEISCRILKTSHAFHSRMMEPIAGQFLELFKNIELRAPQIPYLSNVTGTWIKETQAVDPKYWASHLLQTVRFADGLGELMKQPHRVFLEIGPGNGLTSLTTRHPARSREVTVLPSFGYFREKTCDLAEIRITLGRLWLAGVRVDWPTLHDGHKRHKIPLPTYPFERRQYWIEGRTPGIGPIHEADAARHNGKNKLILALDHAGGENTADSASVSNHPELRTDYAEPRTELQERMAAVWRAILGVDKIGIDDNFFELGGHSLLAVALARRVEQVFGKRLPLATLIEAPTVRQFSEFVRDDSMPSWSSLVPIHPVGTRSPLFLIHGAEGNVLLYRQLTQYLRRDQPVYGLQSKGLNGSGCLNTTIQEMASQYIREVKVAQPRGPYFLGGYCLGGVIAFEMAQQFREKGEAVGLVLMLDTYNLSTADKPRLLFLRAPIHFVQNLWFHSANLFSIRRGNRKQFLSAKVDIELTRLRIRLHAAYHALQRIVKRKERSSYYPHLMVTKANDQAAARYVPKFYEGRVAVIRPKGNFWGLSSPTLGWGETVPGGLEIHEIPVRPKGMLVEPFCRLLAETVQSCLQNAPLSEERRRLDSTDAEAVSQHH